MSGQPMQRCYVCGSWTQLPHAEMFCQVCYSQPWKVRGTIEKNTSIMHLALNNCLIMSPLDPFQRADMIKDAINRTKLNRN